MFTLPAPLNIGNENTTCAQTFPDTAVLVRQTPARSKKHKGELDLGVTTLVNVAKTMQETVPQVTKTILPKVTSTVSKPPGTVSVSWPTNMDLSCVESNERGTKQVDMNFNTLTDQYGNPVEIQGPVVNTNDTLMVNAQRGEPLFTAGVQEPTSAQSMEFLRTSPYLQKLVEDRVSVLEVRMRSELQQGNLGARKKSGRYNVSNITCAPMHLHWPNESCLTGAT